MKNLTPKFVLKVAGTLTAIALVVAAMLGLVNSVTHERIEDKTPDLCHKKRNIGSLVKGKYNFCGRFD